MERESAKGSPPRVRGKVENLHLDLHGLGITPACAGKSLKGIRPPSKNQDHPRVCGEKPFSVPGTLFPSGSPPRVRGKAVEYVKNKVSEGITPACAGKRTTSRIWCSMAQDHPRVCGEKKAAVTTLFWTGGSPPRVRGKDRDIARSRHAVGITPACAGKSISGTTARVSAWDHPRVCGEKAKESLKK